MRLTVSTSTLPRLEMFLAAVPVRDAFERFVIRAPLSRHFPDNLYVCGNHTPVSIRPPALSDRPSRPIRGSHRGRQARDCVAPSRRPRRTGAEPPAASGAREAATDAGTTPERARTRLFGPNACDPIVTPEP